MMRVGFDMDGVLADFASAYRAIEHDLFGTDADPARPDAPEEEEGDGSVSAKEGDRRRRAVWARIRATENFWTSLQPTDAQAVSRLHGLMLRHRWEVVFITQRPATPGETVQRQTQRWLLQHGYDMPSVVVVAGSRGAAINALRLTHHVDDSPQNCLDVKSDSTAMPILVVGADELAARQALRLGITVAPSIGECLTMLEGIADRAQQPGVLRRLASMVTRRA